jgi:hypothetical protein
MDADSKTVTLRALDRTNLRLSAKIFDEIDAACAGRPGNVSRNTWIAEAVEEKLARDRSAGIASSNDRMRARG